MYIVQCVQCMCLMCAHPAVCYSLDYILLFNWLIKRYVWTRNSIDSNYCLRDALSVHSRKDYLMCQMLIELECCFYKLHAFYFISYFLLIHFFLFWKKKMKKWILYLVFDALVHFKGTEHRNMWHMLYMNGFDATWECVHTNPIKSETDNTKWRREPIIWIQRC